MKGAIGFCKNGSSFSLKKLCFKPDTYDLSQMNKKSHTILSKPWKNETLFLLKFGQAPLYPS